MAYTDLTAAWAYKTLVQWKLLDQHAENAALAYAASFNSVVVAFLGANQSIPASTWTKLIFGSTDVNPDLAYDTITGKITPGIIGKWLIGFSSRLVTTTAGDINISVDCAIYKNGAEFKRGNVKKDSATVAQSVSVMAVAIVDVTSLTDYYECYVRQQAGGARNASGDGTGLSTFLYAAKLL